MDRRLTHNSLPLHLEFFLRINNKLNQNNFNFGVRIYLKSRHAAKQENVIVNKKYTINNIQLETIIG